MGNCDDCIAQVSGKFVLTGTQGQAPMNAASSCPRRMLMYFGQNETRSFAALMELAEILMPSVTINRPIAPNAEAARPLCEPELLQSSMISIGFQMMWP
jgi:hypothetical protein